jgi:hypothetical protein
MSRGRGGTPLGQVEDGAGPRRGEGGARGNPSQARRTRFVSVLHSRRVVAEQRRGGGQAFRRSLLRGGVGVEVEVDVDDVGTTTTTRACGARFVARGERWAKRRGPGSPSCHTNVHAAQERRHRSPNGSLCRRMRSAKRCENAPKARATCAGTRAEKSVGCVPSVLGTARLPHLRCRRPPRARAHTPPRTSAVRRGRGTPHKARLRHPHTARVGVPHCRGPRHAVLSEWEEM